MASPEDRAKARRLLNLPEGEGPLDADDDDDDELDHCEISQTARLSAQGWPGILLRALRGSSRYQLGLQNGAVVEFEHVNPDIHGERGEFADLRGAKFRNAAHAPRGTIMVRVADISWLWEE